MFKRRTSLLHRTIVVNLLSGTAVGGVCDYETTTVLIVKGGTVYSPDVEPAQADGEIVIDRANVDFIQIP